MINAQTIRKLAFFVAVAAFIFTIILAILDFLYLDLTTLGAPTSYYLYSVLIEVIPYLFIGVVALIIALTLVENGPHHEEALPPAPEGSDTIPA